MKKFNKLPSASRVSPGNTATVEMPLGPTYERIILGFSAAASLDAADIGRIRVLIDGKEVQTFKNAQRLIDLNGYYGRESDTVGATYIELGLHFSRAELMDNIWRSAPGIGTENVSTFHIEVEIDAAAPADIALVAHAQVDPTRQPLGAFTRIREFPASSSVAGEFEVDKLPRQGWYSAVHFFKDDISAVEVEANGVKLIDATKTVLERFQKGASPKARAPVSAKATHVDWITDGNLMQSLNAAGLQDMRFKLTLDTAGAVDIVTESIDTLA